MNGTVMKKAMKDYMRTGIFNIHKAQQEEREKRNRRYLSLQWRKKGDTVEYCVILNTFNQRYIDIMVIPKEYEEKYGSIQCKRKLEYTEHKYKEKVIELAYNYTNRFLIKNMATIIRREFHIRNKEL